MVNPIRVPDIPALFLWASPRRNGKRDFGLQFCCQRLPAGLRIAPGRALAHGPRRTQHTPGVAASTTWATWRWSATMRRGP